MCSQRALGPSLSRFRFLGSPLASAEHSIAVASQELLDSSIELAAGPCPCPSLTAASVERPVVLRLPTLELALSLS